MSQDPHEAGYIPLPGWYCPACRTWNGLAKVLESTPFKPRVCRVCSGPYVPESGIGRTELLRLVGLLAQENVQLGEQIAKVHERCSQMLDVARAAKRLVDNPLGGGTWDPDLLTALLAEVVRLRAVEDASGDVAARGLKDLFVEDDPG